MIMTILLIITVFLAAMETAIPYLVKRTVVFGVSIPDEYTRDRKLSVYKRGYSLVIASFSAITLLSYFLWAFNADPTEEKLVLVGMSIMFGIMFISIASYFYLHAKTLQRKKARKWGENLKQVKMTDLSVRAQDEMLPWYVFVFPMVITLGLIGYTVIQYSALPMQIPTHWGLNGEPDAFTSKNPISATLLPIILLVMQGMFMGIQLATKKSGIKLSATNTPASRERQLTLRKYTSWFMLLTSLLITVLFTFLQLTTIHEGLFSDALMLTVPFAFLLVVLTVTLIFAIKVGKSGRITEADPGKVVGDFDEDQYWKGGLFYFNSNDPSIFVEKRFGVGWTLNFANPLGYLIVLGPLVIILMLTFI